VTTLVLALASARPSASAQGLDANVLRPGPVGRGTVGMAATETLAPWDIDGSLVFGYASNPVELSDSDGDRVGGVVDSSMTLDLRADVGLPARFEAGLTMPIALRSEFASAYEDGRSSASGGDLGLEVRWNALERRAGGVLGVTPALLLTFPTGSADDLTGSDAVVITPTVTADALVNRFRFALLAGAQLRTREAELDYGRVRQQFVYGGSAEVGIDAQRSLIASLELLGKVDSAGELGPTETLAALRYSTGLLGLLAAGGVGLNDGIGAPDFRVLVGIAFRFRQGGDQDNDGIRDNADACVNAPEDYDGVDDTDGCPDTDNDGDGVSDTADACPAVAEDRDGFEDQDGCPDTDNDGDGVPDTSDRCVAQPEDADGVEDQDGCPDGDNDGDGVTDAADKCPQQPETANGFEDNDGCPDEAPRYVFKPSERLVFNNIEFQTDSDQLLPASQLVLDDIAASLKAQPAVRVRVEGHTDDRGADDKNLSLSQRRALSVVNYLVKTGIDQRRLEYAGYGETRPVDDNKTDAGRGKNRRVEFLTLDQ
jgi:outer membrane protein OmpA-like peptidoglycan-associated protein